MKGLPVITMAEGKQIGKIHALVIDPDRSSEITAKGMRSCAIRLARWTKE